MYRVWIVFLSRNNFYCKTNLNRLEDNLRYSMIALFNAQSFRIFHQCSSFPVQQRAPSHSRALTSHDGARRPWHMVSLAGNGGISNLKLHQTVRVQLQQSGSRPSVFATCHVGISLTSASRCSAALRPDHRMWSGSGVMRTAALVQTRQGWVGGGTPATKLPWENKYVTKETGDWMWLNSERGATSKTNNIHVSACWLFTFAHFAVVTKISHKLSGR